MTCRPTTYHTNSNEIFLNWRVFLALSSDKFSAVDRRRSTISWQLNSAHPHTQRSFRDEPLGFNRMMIVNIGSCVVDICCCISAVNATSPTTAISIHKVAERMAATPFHLRVPQYLASTRQPRILDGAEDAVTQWLLRELDRAISKHLEKRKWVLQFYMCMFFI